MTVSTKCLATAPGCSPANAVVVSESAAVPTVFAKVLGINSFTVHATATACSPCSAKPLDVMLVLDRTGSMCTTDTGADDHPQCTDMQNARGGLKTFLSYMDPTLDHVGFAVLPPAASSSNACPYTAGAYTSPNDHYVLVPLSSDYSSGGVLNTSSPLVSAINCVQANGTTSYANALEAAQAELARTAGRGRRRSSCSCPTVLRTPARRPIPQSSPYRATPCHQGITSSQSIQAAGTIVYSIGYDVGHDICQGLNKNAAGNYAQGPEQPSISALQALQGIASPGNYYNQPTASQLNTIYASVAADILAGTSRLVDD